MILIASDPAAIIIVLISTVFVVAVVLGLHVRECNPGWGEENHATAAPAAFPDAHCSL